ncbi:MAG: rubredoxin [Promethearchaeota archaeon]|nr:MAG: rubredoxin [Candidatus Lokiarchaeota archaeon]
MALYRCKICNYIYDDKENEIIFDDLDEEYRCPKCRASKNHFVKK